MCRIDRHTLSHVELWANPRRLEALNLIEQVSVLRAKACRQSDYLGVVLKEPLVVPQSTVLEFE